ncbi:MAG: hypothetical protein ABJF88_17900 [Rhodothermales bacterium]|jgi:transcriptional regulator with XRE-family HTH domain
MDHYTEESLADAVRQERKRQKLTQDEAAARLVESERYDRITKQAISQAENYRPGDGMTGLRVALYEVLTGRGLEGPVWYDAEGEGA